MGKGLICKDLYDRSDEFQTGILISGKFSGGLPDSALGSPEIAP